MNKDFAVFILTHGRSDNVITYRTLRDSGYTGKVYFIIDNEDSQADRYRHLYGDSVIMFDKRAMASMFDEGDNFDDRRTITHARNASWGIAKRLGVTYFVQLDDDYTGFRYRYNGSLEYIHGWKVKSMDRLFAIVLDYYMNAPILSIAFAQGGDYIGGDRSTTGGIKLWLKRKAMNSFFCSVNRPYYFSGRMNEDVNTYVLEGNKGGLFGTFFSASLEQKATQSNPGGITEAYKKYGTFVKSFYTVMYRPSCLKVSMMHSSNARIHHEIEWDNAVPKIIDERIAESSHGKCRNCGKDLPDYPGENRVYCSAKCALDEWEHEVQRKYKYPDGYFDAINLG